MKHQKVIIEQINSEPLQKNLLYILEKEKLKNVLSSTKTECNLLKSQIESGNIRKININKLLITQRQKN